jgi:hypothetical protein
MHDALSRIEAVATFLVEAKAGSRCRPMTCTKPWARLVAAVTGGRLRRPARARRRYRAGPGDLRFPPLSHLRAAGRRRHDAARLATGGRSDNRVDPR